jgi:hypothetical protein
MEALIAGGIVLGSLLLLMWSVVMVCVLAFQLNRLQRRVAHLEQQPEPDPLLQASHAYLDDLWRVSKGW